MRGVCAITITTKDILRPDNVGRLNSVRYLDELGSIHLTDTLRLDVFFIKLHNGNLEIRYNVSRTLREHFECLYFDMWLPYTAIFPFDYLQ